MAASLAPAQAADSEPEDEDDELDEAELLRQQEIAANRKGPRTSVLAERTVIQEGWKPPKWGKTPEQAAQIRLALSKNFMFQALPEEKMQEVIDAFYGPHTVGKGESVIQQGRLVDSGEPGLYVLEKGKLDVFVKRSDADGPGGKHVKTYDQMGQSFGELALLYNCPRAATVVANSISVMWSIDRDTFNNCVKGYYEETRRRQEGFLNSVEILASLTPNERSKIVDVLQSEKYSNGQSIIKRGAAGDRFFILEQGACMASVDGQVLKEYQPGDYFGELALINDQPRAADIIATVSPTVCLWIDSVMFRRLFGNLSELMEQRAKGYAPISGGSANAAPDGKAGAEGPSEDSTPFLFRLLGIWCQCSNVTPASAQRLG